MNPGERGVLTLGLTETEVAERPDSGVDRDSVPGKRKRQTRNGREEGWTLLPPATRDPDVCSSLIAASIVDEYSVGPYLRPICTS